MKLEDLGWAEPFQSAFDTLTEATTDDASSPLVAARVSSVRRGSYALLSPVGSHAAYAAGRLRHRARDDSDLPAVGDWVAARMGSRGDTARIEAVLPRRSALLRRRPDTEVTPQVIAANLDLVFLVYTLNEDFMGEARLKTAAVRDSDGRGRHTTSHRELIVLGSGALLIDTPGMREVGLWEDGDGVEATFEREHALANACRFSACRHVHEPGCALLEAVTRGTLSSARHRSYLKLLREAAHVERRGDERLRREHNEAQRRVYRMRKRSLRRHPKL